MITMNRVLLMSTSSTSHIFGNVTKAIEMHIKSHLPIGLLKGSAISTRSPSRFLRSYKNTGKEFFKKDYPYMVIRPHYEILSPDDDIFLQGTSLTRYEGSVVNSKLATSEFLLDTKNGFALGFNINRVRITFEVVIQFHTHMMAMDVRHYLLNTFRWGIVDYLPTSLESLIPKETMIHIGECIGTDITKTENIPIFLDYIKSKSSRPITYKMRNSTSQDEYFLYYTQNILTTYSDLDLEDVQKKGMLEDTSTVSFKINCEFNGIGSYILYGAKETFKRIEIDIRCENENKYRSIGYTPIYTYERISEDDGLIASGYSRLGSGIIKSDVNNDGKNDDSDFGYIFDDNGKKIIKDLLLHGEDIGIVYKALIYKDNTLMTINTEYTLNWSNTLLTIMNSDKFATYRIIIYVDLNYYNSHKLDDYNITDQQSVDKDSNKGYQI